MKRICLILTGFLLALILPGMVCAYNITINAEGVTTRILLQGQPNYMPRESSIEYDIPAGNYYLYSLPGGYIAYFDVSSSGTVSYDAQYEGSVLTGSGTSTVTVVGHEIILDGTLVDTNLREYSHVETTNYGGSVTYRLPANDPNTVGHRYQVFSYPGGYDICSFWVNENGTVGFDETEYGGRAQGNGTSSLIIPGHPITLDGTGVDTNLRVYTLHDVGTTGYGGSFTYRLPANDPNTPGHGYSVFSFPGGYNICSFWVNENGTVGFDETEYGGRAQGNGTSSLIIPGHPITLDGTGVDTDLREYTLSGIGTTNYGGTFTYRLPATDPNNTIGHWFRVNAVSLGKKGNYFLQYL